MRSDIAADNVIRTLLLKLITVHVHGPRHMIVPLATWSLAYVILAVYQLSSAHFKFLVSRFEWPVSLFLVIYLQTMATGASIFICQHIPKDRPAILVYCTCMCRSMGADDLSR